MTLPANEIAKKYSTEREREGRELDFVYFLDAREKTQSVILADEQAFSGSWDRAKWGFALE